MGADRQDALAARLQAAAKELGFDAIGFASCDPPQGAAFLHKWLKKGYHGTMSYMARHADVREDVSRLLPGANTVVALAMNYYQPLPQGPKIARYALGRDYHKVLRARLRRLCEALDGYENRVCVDSAPILEREFAHRAGLGWFGKNTMLIDTKRGSWFFIGIVLTTARITPSTPSEGSCGTCKKCIEACPTRAIVREDGRWQVDARRCVSYLTIEHKGEVTSDLAKNMDGWLFGCDVCQEVCPFNEARSHHPQRARPTEVEDFRRLREWPSLKHLKVIEQDEWEILTRGSPVRRTGLEGLRRNARYCLANSRGKTR